MAWSRPGIRQMLANSVASFPSERFHLSLELPKTGFSSKGGELTPPKGLSRPIHEQEPPIASLMAS